MGRAFASGLGWYCSEGSARPIPKIHEASADSRNAFRYLGGLTCSPLHVAALTAQRELVEILYLFLGESLTDLADAAGGHGERALAVTTQVSR